MTRRPSSASTAPGVVRVIGGVWRGTRLPVVTVDGLRPTADRARETLFNWLQPVLPGARVLDLFAGTGALGLEAVSRGAAQAYLLERDPRAAESLRQTVAKLQASERVQIVQADALRWLAAPLHGHFDIVFVDPPFAAGVWSAVLAALPPWLNEDAWLYVESPSGADIAAGGDWLPHREMATRDARHALYRRACSSSLPATLDPSPA